MAPLRKDRLPPVNKIFVDRGPSQKVFEDAAFSIASDRSTIVVFYGAGGQGKTALCRELWRKTDPAIEPSYSFLRRAELDLHGRQTEDPDLLLVWIRNGFAQAGIPLPAFDLALALTWESTRGEQPFPVLSRPWLKRTTSVAKGGVDEAADKAKDWLKSESASELLGDAISEFPGVGFLLRRIGNWVVERTKRNYLELTREFLKELYCEGELKKPYELSQLLPWMLAQDLNCYIAAHPSERLVLFIDEYERVFDEGGAGVRWRENPFDSHLRNLVQHTNGLLAVLFSRERLPWEADLDWHSDLERAQHLIGGLAERDADEYLSAIPIESQDVRRAIIESARERSERTAPVYPLMIDLQIEHWRTIVAKREPVTADRFQLAESSFEGRRRELVARLLRDYGKELQTTIERLSVARRFDRAAFEAVVRTFGTALPLDSFDFVTGLSFMTRSDDGFVTMYNVIAGAIRETLDHKRRRTSIEFLFKHYAARASVQSASEVTDATVAALFEAAFLRRAKGIEGYVDWLDDAARPVEMAARYSNLLELWRETLQAVEALLPPDHVDVVKSLSHLALVLHRRGDLEAARPLFERALAILAKVPGLFGPKSIALFNLASLLRAEGDLRGARPLLESSLAINETIFGPEHPRTASTLAGYATLLGEQGALREARPLFERALAIREKVLGPAHPDTAESLYGFATLVQKQGDLPAARLYFERALAIAEKTLGPEHPNTATYLDSLAMLLGEQGALHEAQSLFDRALAIREKVLGVEHPFTVAGLEKFARLLHKQGEWRKARELIERVVAVREKISGPGDTTLAIQLNYLAMVSLIQGDSAGADSFLERHDKIFYSESPPIEDDSLARVLHDLASSLYVEGALRAARPLFERALAIREKTVGAEHLDMAAGLDGLAALLQDQGDFDAALPLLERALAIREKTLGAKHSDTATSRKRLLTPPPPDESKAFQKWLASKPPSWSVAIAARAALRILPISAFAKSGLGAAVVMLPVFRAMAIARFGAIYPTKSTGAADDAACGVASLLGKVIDTRPRAGATAEARCAAAAAAWSVHYAADGDARYAIDAYVAANGGIKQYTVDGYAARYFSVATKADAQALVDGEMMLATVTRSPLWQDGTPQWASGAWIKLATKLRRSGDHWLVWIDWYDYVLKGSPVEPERTEAWEMAFVDLPECLPWQSGAESVNREIAARLAAVKTAGVGPSYSQ